LGAAVALYVRRVRVTVAAMKTSVKTPLTTRPLLQTCARATRHAPSVKGLSVLMQEHNLKFSATLLLAVIVFCSSCPATGEEPAALASGGCALSLTGTNGPVQRNVDLARYRAEALQLILKEANDVGRALKLPEPNPIRVTDLIEAFISPPQYAYDFRRAGNVTTKHYIYCVSVDNKLSDVIARNQDDLLSEWGSSYIVPASEFDAKAAYRLAAEWMYAASMDVDALNRDCQVVVETDKYMHVPGDNIVPVYWVLWRRGGEPPSIASVRLFLPTKKLLQLRVEESKYILRKPIHVAGLDTLVRHER
jgi:hypothetical protein